MATCLLVPFMSNERTSKNDCPPKKRKLNVISGFRCEVDENSALLHYVASSDKFPTDVSGQPIDPNPEFKPTFRDNVSVSSSGFKEADKNSALLHYVASSGKFPTDVSGQPIDPNPEFKPTFWDNVSVSSSGFKEADKNSALLHYVASSGKFHTDVSVQRMRLILKIQRSR